METLMTKDSRSYVQSFATAPSGRLWWVLSGDFNHPNPVPCGNFVNRELVALPPIQIGDTVKVWDGEGNNCEGRVIEFHNRIARVVVDYGTWIAGPDTHLKGN
jgi:hypothetical protein